MSKHGPPLRDGLKVGEPHTWVGEDRRLVATESAHGAELRLVTETPSLREFQCVLGKH